MFLAHLNGLNAIMFLFGLYVQVCKVLKIFKILNLVLPYFNVKEVKFHIVYFSYHLNKCFNGLFSNSKVWPAGYHNSLLIINVALYFIKKSNFFALKYVP